jgi:hypothetical protein
MLERDKKGRGRGLIAALSWCLPGETEKEHKIPKQVNPVPWLRFHLKISGI